MNLRIVNLIALFLFFFIFSARSLIPPTREREELKKNTILVPPLTMSSRTSTATDAPPELYGTRLAQVVLVRRDGRVTYIERDIWALDGIGAAVRASPYNTRSFIFRLGSDW
jgi:Transport and Golgi organisation 2